MQCICLILYQKGIFVNKTENLSNDALDKTENYTKRKLCKL